MEIQLSGVNGLLKVSLPQQAADLGLADLLFSLRGWFPAGDVEVGQKWQAIGQGPVYSERMSEIGKASTTSYRLASLQGNTATIEGEIALNQSGPARVSATEGKTNVNVIGKGAGRTRFEYDTAGNRIIGGETEMRFEGKLANIAPAAEGEKLQPRVGSVVEVSKYSIKLVQ